MLLWLLALLLLFAIIYIVYHRKITPPKTDEEYEDEQHYTIKIEKL